MWVSIKDMLSLAQPGKYVLGAFHALNLEQVQGILEAALEEKSPAIVALDESAAIYAGLGPFLAMTRELASELPAPVAVMLDHVHDLDLIAKALDKGCTGILYDPRDDQGDDGRQRLETVRALCERNRAWFELEVRGSEGSPGRSAEAAAALIGRARPECACLSLGPEERDRPGEAFFRYVEQLRGSRTMLSVAGAGAWPEADLRRAIAAGIWKISVGTRTNQAFAQGLRAALAAHPDRINPRWYLGGGRDALRESVRACIRAFGSVGTA